MHPDLVALLALQENDSAAAKIEDQVRELDAQVKKLDRERATIEEASARARATADVEERKRRELAMKIQEHKGVQQRNIAILDNVRKAREATAAMTQVDLNRRVLAQEENDLQAISAKITELRQSSEAQALELMELDERQKPMRAEFAQKREQFTRELAEIQGKREEHTARVSRQMLAKYERVRTRDKANALCALQGAACGRCRTAIPLQRRNAIAAGRSIEVCEGCGVLLYATA